ncbi:MAG: replication-associated recombination protein A, partial [Thermotogae bacterium]
MSSSETNWKPLSERLRPEHFDDVVGQYHLTGKNGIIRKALEKRKLFSMILYGAPGTGKTTIGHLIEKNLPDNHEYLYFSATTQRTGELKQLFQRAEQLKRYGTQMVLFVDEIHRLNKAQQDIFLPVTEKGTIILIGATTENPSFEVNPALLSRCRLIILKELKTEDLTKLLKKAIHKDRIIQ